LKCTQRVCFGAGRTGKFWLFQLDHFRVTDLMGLFIKSFKSLDQFRIDDVRLVTRSLGLFIKSFKSLDQFRIEDMRLVTRSRSDRSLPFPVRLETEEASESFNERESIFRERDISSFRVVLETVENFAGQCNVMPDVLKQDLARDLIVFRSYS
jgi:hypothetical protein